MIIYKIKISVVSSSSVKEEAGREGEKEKKREEEWSGRGGVFLNQEMGNRAV